MSATVIPKTENEPEVADCKDVIPTGEPRKICVVCGDKALGYNFNAITCESCKAFFRRNALKKKVYKCRFAGDCEITIASRRYCQKCRLKKCFQVGMMSELITVHPEAEEEAQEPWWPVSVVRKRPSQDQPFYNSPPKMYVPNHTMPPLYPLYPIADTVPFGQTVCTPLPETCGYMAPAPLLNPVDHSEYSLPSVSSHQLDRSPCAGDSRSLSTTAESPTSETADPLVPLPKSVLLHLIDLCHRAPQNPHSHDRHVSHDDYETKFSLANCVCRCTCGAKMTSASSCESEETAIDVEVSQQTDQEVDEKAYLVQAVEKKKPLGTWTTQAFQNIDHIIVTCDKHTSTSLDLVPAGPVVEFPPDIDAWKLFRLEELLSANEILAPPRNGSGPLISYAEPALAADMMDLAIRRTLEMLKCVGAFGTLSRPDQIALFKGSIRELMVLRGAMVYEPSVNSFRPVGYPHRYLRLDVMRRDPDGNTNLKNFYESFHSKWRKCDPVMLCLASMVVFEPSRPNVADVGAVRYHQQFYRDLLKCYLRTAYSPLEAEEVFAKLLDRLRKMKDNLKSLTPTIHIEMSPRDMEPLLIDIIPSQ